MYWRIVKVRNKKMKYVKQIVLMFITSMLIFTLTSCTKCISTETSTVEVKVVDKYYRGAYLTPVNYGKGITMITQPAVYKIIVEYADSTYNIYGFEAYNQYADKVGENVSAIIETKKYDDGTVKCNITNLE